MTATALFDQIYQTSTAENRGAFCPALVAQCLAEQTGVAAQLFLDIFAAPRIHLYPDVHPALDWLFTSSEHVPVLWTQGEFNTPTGQGYQVLKFLATGLLERYPQWQTRAQAFGSPTMIGGFDKQAELRQFLAHFNGRSQLSVAIIDDNLDQLLSAQALLEQMAVPHTLLQLVRTVPPQRLGPNCYRLNDLRQMAHQLGQTKQLLLIDLDYTLIDHQVTRLGFAQAVTKLLTG